MYINVVEDDDAAVTKIFFDTAYEGYLEQTVDGDIAIDAGSYYATRTKEESRNLLKALLKAEELGWLSDGSVEAEPSTDTEIQKLSLTNCNITFDDTVHFEVFGWMKEKTFDMELSDVKELIYFLGVDDEDAHVELTVKHAGIARYLTFKKRNDFDNEMSFIELEDQFSNTYCLFSNEDGEKVIDFLQSCIDPVELPDHKVSEDEHHFLGLGYATITFDGTHFVIRSMDCAYFNDIRINKNQIVPLIYTLTNANYHVDNRVCSERFSAILDVGLTNTFKFQKVGNYINLMGVTLLSSSPVFVIADSQKVLKFINKCLDLEDN